jgi:hypothetical protein
MRFSLGLIPPCFAYQWSRGRATRALEGAVRTHRSWVAGKALWVLFEAQSSLEEISWARRFMD